MTAWRAARPSTGGKVVPTPPASGAARQVYGAK